MYKLALLLFILLGSRLYANDLVDFSHQKIVGVEILVAGEGSGLESSFGHAFLRLVKEDGAWGDDIVVGFVADPLKHFKNDQDLEKASTFKFFSGFVSGKYPIAMQVSSLYDFWSKYVIREGRSIERKIILSTPEDRQRLLATLEDYVNHPDSKLGNYSFLNRNCATMVMELLNLSGFPHPIGGVIKPSSLLSFYENSWNSPYPSLKFSDRDDSKELLKKSNVKDNDPKDVIIKKLTKNLSELEIKKILVVGDVSGLVARDLSKLYPFDRGESFDEAVGITAMPESVYQYCEDITCAEDVYRTLLKDQNIRLKRSLLKESQLAPNPKFTMIENMHSKGNQKIKMTHIYEANGHEQIIKLHYQFLGIVLQGR